MRARRTDSGRARPELDIYPWRALAGLGGLGGWICYLGRWICYLGSPSRLLGAVNWIVFGRPLAPPLARLERLLGGSEVRSASPRLNARDDSPKSHAVSGNAACSENERYCRGPKRHADSKIPRHLSPRLGIPRPSHSRSPPCTLAPEGVPPLLIILFCRINFSCRLYATLFERLRAPPAGRLRVPRPRLRLPPKSSALVQYPECSKGERVHIVMVASVAGQREAWGEIWCWHAQYSPGLKTL